MDIECNLKYEIIRRSTLAVVKDFVETSELKTFVDEVSLLKKKDDSILIELNAHVSSITSVGDRVDPFDKLCMQEINLASPSSIGGFLHDENITSREEEIYTSQY